MAITNYARTGSTTVVYPDVAYDPPIEESEDFREFVIWLCGYTSRHTPPDKAEWEELRTEVKQMAAKFALTTRARRQLEAGVRHAHATAGYAAKDNTMYSSTAGVMGNQALTAYSTLTFK